MANHKALIKQRDLSRVLKGCAQGGVSVSKIEIKPDGTLQIYAGSPDRNSQDDFKSQNEWDEVIAQEN